MADFCKQCSIEIFGQDSGDLARLMDEEKYSLTTGVEAICEGCGGFTTVEYDGTCRSIHCPKHGKENRDFFKANGVELG